uniref:Regulator of G protein signaling 17 n=1 Tax=Laticauda laticaudata TaxID=8630 RepID=A0A8C5RZZ9_LATLA
MGVHREGSVYHLWHACYRFAITDLESSAGVGNHGPFMTCGLQVPEKPPLLAEEFWELYQNPTADEILSWAQNFDKMMKTPAGRNIFREFLRTEYSEENLLFWLACEDLKKEQNKDAIEEKARLIYEDYISILSPKEVSLDSRVREVINRNLLDPSCHMYEDAQLQIYTLMHRDSFPRFLNSQIYKSLLESTRSSTSET